MPHAGHQVFKHRASPRKQSAALPDFGNRPAEAKPDVLRDVAFSNGNKNGAAGFGGEQVVTALHEAAGFGVVADGERFSVGAQEKIEGHFIGEIFGGRGDSLQSLGKPSS